MTYFSQTLALIEELIHGLQHQVNIDDINPIHDLPGAIYWLRQQSKTKSAERLQELREIEEAEGGYDDEDPLDIASVKHYLHFLGSEQDILEPSLGITPNGTLFAQWTRSVNQVIGMDFMTDGLVLATVILPPKTLSDSEPQAFAITMPWRSIKRTIIDRSDGQRVCAEIFQ